MPLSRHSMPASRAMLRFVTAAALATSSAAFLRAGSSQLAAFAPSSLLWQNVHARTAVQQRRNTPLMLRNNRKGGLQQAVPAQWLSMTASPAVAEDTMITGPSWDNSQEYASLQDPLIKEDLEQVKTLTDEIRLLAEGINLGAVDSVDSKVLVQATKKRTEASVLLANVATFASCETSVDATNAAARALQTEVQALSSALTQAAQSASLALKLVPDTVIATYLEELPDEKFNVEHERKLRDLSLSLAEENLITALSVNGHSSWGKLYSTLGATIECDVNGKRLGIAQTAALLSSGDGEERRAAWEAVQAGWRTHEEAAAASLDSIIGWRLETNKRRAQRAGREVHYLDTALHQNRMSRKTLDAMLLAVSEAYPLGRKALQLQARALKLPKLHPADLVAPPPKAASASELTVPFPAAVDLIADSLAVVHPSIGEFVQEMAAQKWIEARSGSKKAPGAYCTRFAKSRNPRVYMSAYKGSYSQVSTLAHELGHAFHNWVMKDMGLSLTRYPMNLAETASLFFEISVSDQLMAMAKTPEERLQYHWHDAEQAGAFLLNIPARFEFESSIWEEKLQGKTLTPDLLRTKMREAWEKCYGEALSDADEMFWASKLHFHITGAQFYNFPYTFGYLFALGVYAQQEAQGESFHAKYTDLLRDTGRMTAEEVVQKHLNLSIEDPEFWRGSIRIIQKQIQAFEEQIEAAGL